jgi:hypothetical protein
VERSTIVTGCLLWNSAADKTSSAFWTAGNRSVKMAIVCEEPHLMPLAAKRFELTEASFPLLMNRAAYRQNEPLFHPVAAGHAD